MVSCQNKTPTPSESNTQKKNYVYDLIDTVPHDTKAFTQGLVFDQGLLYETTGLYNQSSVRQVDPKTGEVLLKKNISTLDGQAVFLEGCVKISDRLHVLTWKNKTSVLFDASSLEKIETKALPINEAWGLTYNGEYLIVSDGSHRLYYLEPNSYDLIKTVEVMDDSNNVSLLNELEWVSESELYANLWQQNKIAIIDPSTSKVKAYLDLAVLQEKTGISPLDKENVLNGIAYDRDREVFYVTGKRWPFYFVIKLRQQP